MRLEYFAKGEGDRKILFLHGFQASARIWTFVQDLLPGDRFTTVAINNRGAGGSDAPPDESDFGIEPFAADAFELVEQLGWTDFTLVGHSLGGATAARFAVDHPDRLNGLVLLDPVDPDGRVFAPGGMTLEATIDAAMAQLNRQKASGLNGDGIGGLGDTSANPVLSLLAQDMAAAPERRLRGSLRSMFNIRLGDRLKALPFPVLLAGGDADALIPLTSMLATWAKLPAGSGLHMWHGVGHSPNVECPGDLAALLIRFVDSTIRNT